MGSKKVRNEFDGAKRMLAESQRRAIASKPKNQARITTPPPKGKDAPNLLRSIAQRTVEVLSKHRFQTTGSVVADSRIATALLKSGKHLDLEGLGLAILPESISQLTQLQTLRLQNNRLTSLPESICRLVHLRELDVSNNELTALPDSIGKLFRLRYLNIQHNHLLSLPESICQFVSLQKLDVRKNRLVALPDSLLGLKRLQMLDASENNLEAAPESIGQLGTLRTLELQKNRLKVLPDSLMNLTELSTLDLSNNRLARLPTNSSKLSRLQQLDISSNKFLELPEALKGLTSLKRLNASSNPIRALPEWLFDLDQIEQLRVIGASLTKISESLGRLRNLSVLDLRENEIVSLPDSIAQLVKLNYLDISRNAISPLPKGLLGLTQLQTIHIHGNPDSNLPPELVGVHPLAALTYYFSTLVSRPLNEAKVILVGRGGVGKTSIVRQLVHRRFDPKEDKTHGIDITRWEVQINKEQVRLNIWDFGGQEIMHATHQFFLTKRSLYLLVLNAREGEQDGNVEYWLRLIQSFGADSPVLVVINKTHQHAFDLNRRGLREKYPTIKDFIQTDCESEHGLSDLRRAILREIDRLDHLRDPFPEGWFSVKEALSHLPQREGRSFISFARYQALCAEHGVKDVVSQETLVDFLHDLGIVVNFREDPRLAETHVLNPGWVTNGIYRILNAEWLHEQGGVLSLDQLASVLDRSEYPRAMHVYLLELMRKFELCYEMHDADRNYLVPELLGKEEPDLQEFGEAEALRFNYKYNILPEGLLPRFIVRSRALNKNLPRWRTGVVLEWERNRASVKADLQDRTVSVSIVGDRAGRRRLLAVIRADFDAIHRSITRLEAREEVPVPRQPELTVEYSTLCVLESEGVAEHKLVLNGKLVTVKVVDLLNGVEEPSIRPYHFSHELGIRRGVRVAFSYSHKDEELRDQLETHIKLLQRQGIISTWHDRRIVAGENWADAIDDSFNRADLILLLVSADFLASDYCYQSEMALALAREAKGEARVLPILLRACDWNDAPFGSLQGLPKDMKPITSWANRDEAFAEVAHGIRKVAKEILRH
jgi:internalin A